MKKKSKCRLKAAEQKIYRKRRRKNKYLKFKNRLSNGKKVKQSRRLKSKEKFRGRDKAFVSNLKVLKLPKNFSFIENPREVNEFFIKVKLYADNGNNIKLDFTHVKQITADVIPILLAKTFKYKQRANISGNRPLDLKSDKLLYESGFYKIVGLYQHTPKNTILDTHKSKIVDPHLAQKARLLTAEKTFKDIGKKIPALYRTLIECMGNTRQHAYSTDQGGSWWLSVFHNPETDITSFSFCDTGVGIFKSTKIKGLKLKLALAIGFKSNKDVLLSILEGKIESSTGLHYRGKGLPKIYSDYRENLIKRLIIVSNDVFADFDSGTFIDLKDEFNGTFLHWEITP